MRSLPKTWSSTLSLPKSGFPVRSVLADRSRYLKSCSDDLYKWQSNRGSLKLFTLQDGPPYANGSLHIGHALNKILKDITCRFQISQGRRVQYIPGWDCHGLPIELKALQKQRDLDTTGTLDNPEPVSVRKLARDLAVQAIEAQKQSFRQWGVMADWDKAWTTMDKTFEIWQLRVFQNLVHQGLIYRRFKPVYWSPSSRTALAEAELEYKENHTSTAAFVKYRIHTVPPELRAKIGLYSETIQAVIWTTTPWTLPANKAIGINSDLNYSIFESGKHEFLLLAHARVGEVQTLCNFDLKLKCTFQGSELLGTTYIDTTFNRNFSPRPFLHADFVSAASGSGLVHLAPGHGMDDYELCTEHKIAAFAPVDDEGRFTALAMPKNPDLLLRKQVLGSGNDAVLEMLAENDRLLGRHKYKHKYPYDWRSKQPVIVRATEQWFANVGELRTAALQSLDSVAFIPESGEERLRSFVKNRNEWCISRQRAWGVPVPALFHKITGDALMDEKSVSHLIDIIEERGIDSWWSDDELDPVWTPPWLRDDDGKTSYIRGKDTMDVWIDSGTSWTQTNNQSRQQGSNVADVYLEGTDQHRGWFQSSLLTYIALQKEDSGRSMALAPFKQLVTHGFTLDQHGRKMSKSLGNVISPEEIMEGTLLPPMRRRRGREKSFTPDPGQTHDSLGPDALRLWVASCDFRKDVIISQAVLKAVNGSLSKYRVLFNFLLGILDRSLFKDIPFLHLQANHQIALMQLRSLQISVRNHYQRYAYNRAISEINQYITHLSAFYIESIKDAVYAGGEEIGQISNRQMTQYTILHIFTALQQMLAPVTPLLIEETWDYTPSRIKEWQGYPFHRQWTRESDVGEGRDCWHNKTLARDLPILMQANAAIKSAQEIARSEKKMGSSLESFVLIEVKERPCLQRTKSIESVVHKIFQRYLTELETIFVVSKVDVSFGTMSAVVDADWSYKAYFQVNDEKVCVHIYAPQKGKCVRCWRYAAPIVASSETALCDRCDTIIERLRTEEPELF